jgi:hypothetical protein
MHSFVGYSVSEEQKNVYTYKTVYLTEKSE